MAKPCGTKKPVTKPPKGGKEPMPSGKPWDKGSKPNKK